MKRVEDLGVKLFADGADRSGMLDMYRNPLIKGFTTNPTLMRKAGLTDYEAFAREIVSAIPDRPISLEVFADEFPEMERQGLKICSWGDNMYLRPRRHQREQRHIHLVRICAQRANRLRRLELRGLFRGRHHGAQPSLRSIEHPHHGGEHPPG